MHLTRRGSHWLTGVLLASGGLACGSTEPGAQDCDAIAAALVTRVEVTPAEVSLALGGSRQLQARAFSCAGALDDIESFTWQTNDPTVASADPSGMVTSIGTGTVTITATTQNRSGTARVTVVSTAPAALRFLQQPSSAAAGVTLAPAVRVQLLDAQGAPVTSSSAPVTLVLEQSNGATLSGLTSTVPVNGLATFATLAVTRAGTYTLGATSPGLAGASSAPFSITAGPASRMLFTVQPCPAACLERVPLAPAPQVTLQDDFGNRVLTSSAQVNVELIGAGSRTTLGGTRSVRAVAGSATFSTLTVSRSAGGISLRATSTGLPAAGSAAFSVTSQDDDD